MPVKWLDAQVAVLGSLLIDPEHVAGEVFHRATAEDFSNDLYREVFVAARSLFLSGKPVDPVAVVNLIGAAKSETVMQLMTMTPTAANCGMYLDILRDQSDVASAQAYAGRLMGASTMEDVRKIFAEAEHLLSGGHGRKIKSYGEMISDYLDRQNDKSPPNYLTWGEEHLDRILSISPGRFVVLGADNSVGKTALAFQLAHHMAKSGRRVGFFSYETSAEDSVDRILANAANVELPRSKKKQLTGDDFRRVSDEGIASDKIPLTLIEAAGCTVDDIRAETLAQRFDVIFIDYLQLIETKERNDRYQTVAAISMALHSLSQQIGVTVIALSQVTPPEPDKYGRRRALNRFDLRESRQLSNDADAVLLLDLEAPTNRNGRRLLLVDKNKDGPTGQIYLSFDPMHMRFNYSPPPKSETYKAIDEAVAKIKKEDREKKKQEAIEGQVQFHELPDDGEPVPF